MPYSVAIDKTETTNKVIFISLYRDVDSNEFSSKLGTRLFDTKRFTIARETRDKRRVEDTGLNNFLISMKLPNWTKESSFAGIRFCSIAGKAAGEL